MTCPEFREAVKKMRAVQIAYFASRDPEALNESKRLEKRIDEELDKINKPLSLF